MADRGDGVVYAYHAMVLHDNLSFPSMSIELTAPSRLKRRERVVCGSEFNSPFLATKGGLERPLAIYVDDKLLPFRPELRFFEVPEVGLSKGQEVEWYQQRRKTMGDSDLPEEYAHGHFNIWALNQYPALDNRIEWKAPLDHQVFAPEADIETLAPHVMNIYEQLIGRDPHLEDRKPIVMGWYTSNNRFRLATRPNRGPGQEKHPLSVATTLERCVIHK